MMKMFPSPNYHLVFDGLFVCMYICLFDLSRFQGEQGDEIRYRQNLI